MVGLIEDKHYREKRAYVRISRDMRFAEIAIPGWGPIYRRKIGRNQDPMRVADSVKHYARTYYRFKWVR